MSRIDDYVQIMVESLKKKSIILGRLIDSNAAQYQLLEGKQFEDVNWDKFELIVADKEAEIARINEMDEGFQALYDRVSSQLKENKSQYADSIKAMQALITELEEKSVQIRTGEERNRALIEKIMSGRKGEIKQARTSLKAATSYYQTMQKNFFEGSASMNTRK